MKTVNTSSSYHSGHFFNEWMDHSAFHEAPLGNAIVYFEPHFVIISLFSHSTSSYLLIDSHDVHAAFQGILEFHSFTRPSRPFTSVGTYPLTIPPHGGVNWVESHGMGRLPSSPELLWQKRDLLSPVPLSFTLLSFWKWDLWGKGSDDVGCLHCIYQKLRCELSWCTPYWMLSQVAHMKWKVMKKLTKNNFHFTVSNQNNMHETLMAFPVCSRIIWCSVKLSNPRNMRSSNTTTIKDQLLIDNKILFQIPIWNVERIPGNFGLWSHK